MNIQKIKENSIIDKEIVYFKEIDSTHLYAKKILENKNEPEKIIIASMQTAGIGTKGRKWYTGFDNNIAMTIILKPNCKIAQLENLTVDIAKKIQKAIKELYGYELTIKEPNDLMLNNKKICGILTEINTIGEKINYLLISIGFNVNEENFSEETKNLATSLKKEYNKNFSIEEIIIKILENLKGIEF